MKNLLSVICHLSILLVLAACSRNTCPPATIEVKDSIVNTTDTQYYPVEVKVPGATVTVNKPIPCPEFNFDTIVRQGRTSLNVSAKAGQLTATCTADSLNLVIDSLSRVITAKKERYYTKTITITNTVTKYKTPAWCWWLLFIIGATVGAGIFLAIKAPGLFKFIK